MAVDGQLDQTLRSAQATLCARTSATRRQALDPLAQTCVLSVSTFNSRRGRQVTNPDIATACIGSLGFRTVKCCFIPPESGWAVSSSAKGDSRPTHIAGEGAEGHDRQSAHTRRHLGQQANEPRRVLGPGCRGDPFSALTNVLAAWRRPSFHLLVLDSGGRQRTAMHEGEGHGIVSSSLPVTFALTYASSSAGIPGGQDDRRCIVDGWPSYPLPPKRWTRTVETFRPSFQSLGGRF
jgi:hypothetical protein